MEGITRIGKVSDVNAKKRLVRVQFEDVGMVSGWLKVLKNPPFIPSRGVQRTESASGGSGENAFAAHTHEVIIEPWFPDISDIVLCIYDPVFNGDGYVLGAL